MTNIYPFKVKSEIIPKGRIKRTPMREAIAIILHNPILLDNYDVSRKLFLISKFESCLPLLMNIVNSIPYGFSGCVIEQIKSSGKVKGSCLYVAKRLLSWELPMLSGGTDIAVLIDALDSIHKELRDEKVKCLCEKHRTIGLSRIEKFELQEISLSR